MGISDWNRDCKFEEYPLGEYTFGSETIIEVSSSVGISNGEVTYSVERSDGKVVYGGSSGGSSDGNVSIKIYGSALGESIGSYSIIEIGSYSSGLSDRIFERKMEGSVGVSEKVSSETRVVMAIGPLLRSVNEVVVAVVVAVKASSDLSSGVRCSVSDG